MGESFPRVDGKFSLDCYKRAAEHCFGALVDGGDADQILSQFAGLCFHVPFPKMVKKAFFHLAASFGWSEDRAEDLFARRVDPFLGWNRMTGNAYTASLWLSVAEALAGRAPGERLAAFSYGSGFGAELLTLTAGPGAAAGEWARDVELDLAARHRLDAMGYEQLRGVSLAESA